MVIVMMMMFVHHHSYDDDDDDDSDDDYDHSYDDGEHGDYDDNNIVVDDDDDGHNDYYCHSFFLYQGDYIMCIYNGHKDNNDGVERLVAFNFRAIAQGENDYEFVGLQSELTGI